MLLKERSRDLDNKGSYEQLFPIRIRTFRSTIVFNVLLLTFLFNSRYKELILLKMAHMLYRAHPIKTVIFSVYLCFYPLIVNNENVHIFKVVKLALSSTFLFFSGHYVKRPFLLKVKSIE